MCTSRRLCKRQNELLEPAPARTLSTRSAQRTARQLIDTGTAEHRSQQQQESALLRLFFLLFYSGASSPVTAIH